MTMASGSIKSSTSTMDQLTLSTSFVSKNSEVVSSVSSDPSKRSLKKKSKSKKIHKESNVYKNFIILTFDQI